MLVILSYLSYPGLCGFCDEYFTSVQCKQGLHRQVIENITHHSLKTVCLLRNGDLRRWWYSLPWILVYGMNITGLLAAGIVGLFTLEGVKKAFGLLPLGYG